jgi:hypothetical protein
LITLGYLMFSVNCGRKRTVVKRVAHGEPKDSRA